MSNITTKKNFSTQDPRTAQELADLVQHTINQIQEKFQQMSDSVMTRIDGMSQQIDQLERNIAQTLSQTNAQLPS